MEWLSKNADWLFSGGGVVLLVAVATWISKRILPRPSPSALDNKSLQSVIDAPPFHPPEVVQSMLSPAKIHDTIDSAPLLQQEDIREQFEGLKVSWTGTLRDAEKEADGSVRLMILVGDELNGYVFVRVNPAVHPGIGLLRQGHRINFDGVIESVSAAITLRDSTIRFNVS